MFKLRRMRFDSIGSNSARFVDLTLDFTDAEHETLDTIVWLRNGGGKTSLLALLFSLFLPNQRDFLGAGEDRKTLGDYVLSGDTAHVQCEWDTPSGPLITGALYEWPERHRPVDHEKHLGDLARRWYAFTPKPDVLSFDVLPIRDDQGRRRHLDAYVRELRALGKAHPLTGLVVAPSAPEWRAALLQRGIDPAVFLYQKKMNKGEGAIDEQFRFPDGQAFVSFLIDMVVDAEASESVSTRLTQLADKLGRRPATETELEYCEGVTERLGPIATTWEDLGRAEGQRDAATARARRVAAELRGAHEAAAATEDRAEVTRAAAAARRTVAETARTTARERAREYQRRGVEFWVQEAEARVEELGAARRDVELELAGWRALDHVIEIELATAEIAEIDRRLAAKASGAEPLRLARNRSASALRRRYLDQLAAAERQRQESLDRAGGSDDEAGRSTADADAANVQAGVLSEQVRARQAELSGIEAALHAARQAGHMRPGEDAETALVRWTTTAADLSAALGRLEGQIAHATRRQSELVVERTELGGEIARANAVRDADAAELAQRRREEAALSAHERVRELAQSDAVSIWAAATQVDGRLGEEIDRADAAVVAEEVQAGKDRRNRAALGDGGLLPPSEDVEAILAVLDAAGVRAVAGLSYLASSVARRDWDATIAAHPGLLSGVLVDAGDIAAAVTAVVEAGLHPASLVTVAKKADLRDAGKSTFVVPPSAALYDSAAAEQERKVLDRRLADLEQRKGVLLVQREADRQLRDRMRGFVESCPHGHLEVLERKLAEQALSVGQLESRLEALDAEADTLAPSLADAGARRTALVSDQLEARDRIGVLTPLAARSAGRSALAEDLVGAEAGFADASERAVQAASRATEARRDAERLRAEAIELQMRHGRVVELVSQLSLVGEAAWDEEPISDATVTTEVLVADLRARDEEYWDRVSDPVLEDRRHRAELQAADSARALATAGAEAEAEARELRARPEALDAESRGRIRAALGTRRDSLVAQAAVADTDHADARAKQRELQRELEPRGRQVYRGLNEDELPVDREDAKRREAEADAEAQRQQAAVTEAELEAREAATLREGAKTRKDLLRVLASGLEAQLPAHAADTEVPASAFAGSDEDAQALQEEVAAELKAAAERFVTADRQLGELVNALWNYANRPKFEAAGSLREVITTGDAADVGRRSGELAEQHRVRATVLRKDLEAISLDQEILVTDLSGQVRRVLELLTKVPTTSQMDRSLGEWGGKSFLTINFDDISSAPDELARRVGTEVDAIVARGGIPDGLSTLKKAVHAAVPGGFKVHVLKPTADLRVERVPVSVMAKWSGGEKLTAAVVLYCIVARLRARSRTRELWARSSGALILDNPLGKASYVGFLALQRRVAEALGVQLLYTTAVRDLKAVGTFPNVIRCRNYTPAGSDRGFVAAVERAGEAHGTSIEGLVSAARVVRLDSHATLPVADHADTPEPGSDVVA